MINLLIVTHGEFGAYLLEAAESIIGRQAEGVKALSISSRLSLDEVRVRLEKAVEELLSREGLVLLTDMPGGTPGNLALPLAKSKPNVAIISGLNLYMLISAFKNRKDLALPALVEKIAADGRRSISDVLEAFESQAARSRHGAR
jgi:PTS system mannose-specific IIA component